MHFGRSSQRALWIAAAAALTLAACGGGGGSGGGGVTPIVTPTPVVTPSLTPPPPPVAAYFCTSPGAPQARILGSLPQSITRTAHEPPALLAKRNVSRTARTSAAYVSGLLEVNYARNTYPSASARAVEQARSIAQPTVEREIDFGSVGHAQVLRVDDSKVDAVKAKLEAQPGVLSVSRVQVRYKASTTALAENDTYYNGFAPANVPPFYESAASAGQWDMHVMCFGNAWGYSTANNSLGRTFPSVGSGVKIAIVDTGADVTHPELTGKVAYFETDQSTQAGTASPAPLNAPMHDNDGHGTDVAGIAAGNTNNNLGFASAGNKASLMIFRVFPDPPTGGCSPTSTSAQCTASSTDIASAIKSATDHGANVINLSLGGGGCTNGVDTDPTEGAAVSYALSHNVVVVAASGNGDTAGVGQSSLIAPACISGVIGVGATSINDSVPSSPYEYVASYSNYSTSAKWGVVASGGDPKGGTDSDFLHWIENIFTSTSNDPSTPPSQVCKPDYLTTSVNDCRILIAGTSQATPHVSGAVALLLGESPGLTPAQVFNALCSTATDIRDSKQGCGRVNVYRAMAQLVGDPSP